MPDTTEPHVMTLEQTFPSGAQQWRCPTCQRRTVQHFLPHSGRFKSITLEAGDEQAAHSTGSAALRTGAARVGESPSLDEGPSDGGWLH